MLAGWWRVKVTSADNASWTWTQPTLGAGGGGAGRGGPTLQGRGGVQDVCTRIRTNTGLHSAVWRPGAAAGDNKLLVYKYVINVIGR